LTIENGDKEHEEAGAEGGRVIGDPGDALMLTSIHRISRHCGPGGNFDSGSLARKYLDGVKEEEGGYEACP